MQKIVLDTNILIGWINTKLYSEILLNREYIKYVPGVVFLELYAGALSRRERAVVDTIFRAYAEGGRILLPTATDYKESGVLMARLQQDSGIQIRKAVSLAHDLLVVLLARRIGATVITEDRKDLNLIHKICPFSLFYPKNIPMKP
ncbi:MAG TPA: PIN domain-containing protein [Nitrospiria bacterium]|nr:PIN domain-containing protein [Nitrospiria bacterium]